MYHNMQSICSIQKAMLKVNAPLMNTRLIQLHECKPIQFRHHIGNLKNLLDLFKEIQMRLKQLRCVGVNHPCGRTRLLNRASVLMISLTASGSLHPGRIRFNSFLAVVPSFFANRFRASLSPRLDALRCSRRSLMSLTISLFLVVQCARYKQMPSPRTAARPIFVPDRSQQLAVSQFLLFFSS